ncbi:FAD-binding oxidoreductase [Candidatus Endoriftia persephone]|jgi:FAD/FMN-containing dehydrogenase|uniref:FAD-binding oxidoreductase n=2 Tax=Gammaproteobacteria TaxID=1236 RepID=A0A9J7A1V1_9GAMM|nr:FAD-binding oxidoreductase [Candidatus Endoriftia persephone]EGV50706.1 putative FAD-dependent dehydrogenase [endosymbiont of Riftia pachyptila (vent Ph05)]USF88900.1 FAD-binding oxidoreductase [Candidatus Endoriftia persephone]
MKKIQSWGKFPKTKHSACNFVWRNGMLPQPARDHGTILPFGNGRSYGDSCLNHNETLVLTRKLNHFISFDPSSGILCCESGLLLSEILRLIIPQGWFLPVTPGTKLVTLGGAIANDVHGKNHHNAGTFGCHVIEFELLRSDKGRLICSPRSNKDLFSATIGGLGLTGIITWAKLRLLRISNPFMEIENIQYTNLNEFFDLSHDSNDDYTYTVSWLDCMAKGKSLGRGIFSRANHAAPCLDKTPSTPCDKTINFPIDAPQFLLNRFTVKTFNQLYYHKQLKPAKQKKGYFDPFFYPLDSIHNWNRLYGKAGFMQYQCLIPFEDGNKSLESMLKLIASSGYGSFLAVLKTFSDIKSPGMMSFPKKGVTLALDFPNHGQNIFTLLDKLDCIVRDSGGSVYPAKDARMSSCSFQHYFPQWQEFQNYIDPIFSSSFWRRVTGELS